MCSSTARPCFFFNKQTHCHFCRILKVRNRQWPYKLCLHGCLVDVQIGKLTMELSYKNYLVSASHSAFYTILPCILNDSPVSLLLPLVMIIRFCMSLKYHLRTKQHVVVISFAPFHYVTPLRVLLLISVTSQVGSGSGNTKLAQLAVSLQAGLLSLSRGSQLLGQNVEGGYSNRRPPERWEHVSCSSGSRCRLGPCWAQWWPAEPSDVA